MPLVDHPQPICPTGEERSWPSFDGAPETPSTHVERQGRQIPSCVRLNNTQQPAQATPYPLFMLGSEIACSVRVHHSQDVVGRDAAPKGAGCRSVTWGFLSKNTWCATVVMRSQAGVETPLSHLAGQRVGCDRLSTPRLWGQLSGLLQSTTDNQTDRIRQCSRLGSSLSGLQCGNESTTRAGSS